MSGDNSTEVERKRGRAAEEASSWKNSVERLKAIRQGGLGNLSASGGGYELEQPVDDEYDAIVKCEGILEEVLAKVNPDDMDRERHRRRKQAATVPIKIRDSDDKCDHVAMENELMKEDVTDSVVTTLPQTCENMELPTSDSEGSNNIRQSEEAKAESGVKKEAICKGGTENGAEFDLDADGSLRFYILDAYEEAFGASMGTVYLFGKVSLLEFHSF